MTEQAQVEYGGFAYPTLSPYMFYEDLSAALEFLAAAFGFTERMRNTNPRAISGSSRNRFREPAGAFVSPRTGSNC